MTSPSEPLPALFLVGATASGKTDASLALAQRYGMEVVNADSRLVYRGMDIGTAKPSLQERASVPHHLLDLVNPDEPYSLAMFLVQAREAIASIQGRRRLPLVVGGTGQYVWGMVEGWQVPQVPPQPQLRERLEQEAHDLGPEALHQRLRRVDAEAAQAIDPRNVRRVVRALEVWETTGRRFSAQRGRATPNFTPHILGLWTPRQELHRRIDARVEAMVEAGWVDEVRSLLEHGYAPELPSFSSAGYREIAAYLQSGQGGQDRPAWQDQLAWQEAMDRTKVSVHRLARRQHAWFRRSDPRIRWAGSNDDLLSEASLLVERLMVESATDS